MISPATRISSNVRPQDPGGGAPRRMMDVDVSATPELSGGGGGGDLSRSPQEYRWCWSRRPWLGALHVWGVHVMTRGNDSRLELGVVLGGCCPIPGLPVLMLQMYQHCPVGALVGSLTDFGGVGR